VIPLSVADSAINERVTVFTTQIKAAGDGPVPLLLFRDHDFLPGACAACGDPLGDGRIWGRCAACAEAARLAVAAIDGQCDDDVRDQDDDQSCGRVIAFRTALANKTRKQIRKRSTR
jgi:hypothetical protein